MKKKYISVKDIVNYLKVHKQAVSKWIKNTDLNDDKESTKDTAFSLKYDVSAFWTIKAEFHQMDGTSFLYRADQEDGTNMEKDWNLFSAKLSFNF